MEARSSPPTLWCLVQTKTAVQRVMMPHQSLELSALQRSAMRLLLLRLSLQRVMQHLLLMQQVRRVMLRRLYLH